jgi:ABC-type multidrug transport system ATPase subunit
VRETIELPQGKLVSVQGSHGSGKTTFMSLLAGILYPRTGSIYIPSHLRILHVAHKPPWLVDGSLWTNLVYGAVRPNQQRIKRILQRLPSRASASLVQQLEDELKDEELRDGDGQAWRATLTYTDQVTVHLVRALIMNPEVMVIHRPMSHFDHETQPIVFQLLKEHVRLRGLEMGDHPKDLRRPRSVFYSTDYPEYARQADVQVEAKTILSEWSGHAILSEINVVNNEQDSPRTLVRAEAEELRAAEKELEGELAKVRLRLQHLEFDSTRSFSKRCSIFDGEL